MIFYRIALMAFLLSLSVSLVNSWFVASAQTLDPESRQGLPFAPDERWPDEMQDAAENWNVSQQNVGQTSLGYGDVFGGIALLKGLADATVTLWWFLESLGLPSELNAMITGGVYLSYLVAGVYMLSGRDPSSQ